MKPTLLYSRALRCSWIRVLSLLFFSLRE